MWQQDGTFEQQGWGCFPLFYCQPIPILIYILKIIIPANWPFVFLGRMWKRIIKVFIKIRILRFCEVEFPFLFLFFFAYQYTGLPIPTPSPPPPHQFQNRFYRKRDNFQTIRLCHLMHPIRFIPLVTMQTFLNLE